MLARVIAVADAYDVMTARDSYREPVSSYEAIVELRRVAGTQLDLASSRPSSRSSPTRTCGTATAKTPTSTPSWPWTAGSVTMLWATWPVDPPARAAPESWHEKAQVATAPALVPLREVLVLNPCGNPCPRLLLGWIPRTQQSYHNLNEDAKTPENLQNRVQTCEGLQASSTPG